MSVCVKFKQIKPSWLERCIVFDGKCVCLPLKLLSCFNDITSLKDFVTSGF